jgi:hypothetical protein
MARREYTGVFLEKSTNRYRAKHSKISLGTFATEEEAAKAKDLGALAVQKDTGRKVSTRGAALACCYTCSATFCQP